MTADTTTPLLQLILMGTGNDPNAWGQNLNDQLISRLDNIIAGVRQVTVNANPYTLSATDLGYNTMSLNGTITADQVIIAPDLSRRFMFSNNLSGAFACLLKTTTATNTVNLPAGAIGKILCPGNGYAIREDGAQIGEIFYFAGTAVPAGSFECDGSALKRASYPSLYAAIGTTWGNNDSSDFKLPDGKTLGKFLRSRTAAVAVGTAQSSQNKSHTHTGSGTSDGASVSMSHTHTGSGTTSGVSADHTHTFTSGAMNSNAAHTHTGSGTSSGMSVDHTHGVSGTTASGGVDHTHTGSGTSSDQNVDHTHTGTSDGPNVTLAHTHTYSGTTGGISASHTHVAAVPQQGNAGTGSPITTAFSEGGNNKVATVLNVTSGNQSADHTHTYSGTTASDSGTLSHTHTFTTGGASSAHTHTYSFTTSAASAYNHTHTFSVTSAGASVDHTHTLSFTTASTNIDHTHSGTTAAQSAGHTHTYSFTTAATDLAHTHTYSFTTSTGSADGTEARPESLVGLMCIRY